MSEEWDEVSNDPEDSEVEESPFAGITANTIDSGTAWGGGQYTQYIDSAMAVDNNEIIRVSAENDFECNRHGRVQSFRLFANGYGGTRPPREINTCLHCFMDMVGRHCEHTDSDEQRSRERSDEQVMAYTYAAQAMRENRDEQE